MIPGAVHRSLLYLGRANLPQVILQHCRLHIRLLLKIKSIALLYYLKTRINHNVFEYLHAPLPISWGP